MIQKGGAVDLVILGNRIKYIIGIIIIVFITSCTSTKQISKQGTNSLSHEEEMKFKYSFFEGNRYYLSGDFDKAEGEFIKCLRIDSSSAATYYKLASIYLYRKDFSTAENYAKKSVDFNKTNVWYKYLLGNLYANNGKYNEASEIFGKLIEQSPEQLDFYLSLTDIQLKANDLKSALKTMESIEDNFGISEMVAMEKHKLYIQQKDYKNALKVLEDLEKAYPKNLNYKKLIAEFYVKIGNYEKLECGTIRFLNVDN